MAEKSTIDTLLDLIKSQLLDVNTAIPGEIVSYSNGIASVRPVAQKRFADGDVLDYPIIRHARVCWPSFAGGTAGIKGPVTPGDRCLLVFAQQAIDGTDDRRTHDLQDAYAVMADLGNAGQSDSGNNSDMTMYHGSGMIRITAEGAINIEAPAGVMIAGKVIQSGGSLTSNGITVDDHVHSGVESGSEKTGGPE